jgi:hypothetical protein
MSVVLADPCHAETIQEAMLGLRYGKTLKLHWRDEPPRRRRQIAETVATLPVAGLVVVRSDPQAADRLERRRRKCLEHLLPMLADMDVEQLTLESRGPADDAKDREMLQHLRRGKRLSRTLHLDHTPGPQDPALWAADALCGATVSHRTGDDSTYLEVIETGVTVQIVTI